MTNARTSLVIGMLCLGCLTQAQDPHFTQFYATPTYISPAFAGTSLQTRIGLVYRDQWPAIPGSFITANLAYDQYLSEVNSGIGFMLTHDRAGSGALRSSSFTGQYAYEMELKRKVFLRPALEMGYTTRTVDYAKLIFSDQLARNNETSTYEHLTGHGVSYFDMGTGLLLFTPELWAGISIHHLNRPDQGLLGTESRVPRKFSAHGGYRMKIRTPVIQQFDQTAVFAFNYRAQEKYDQLDLGVYYEREPFFAGLWYRGIPLFKSYRPGYSNSDAIAVLVGVSVNDLRIGYSYDITVSSVAGRTPGSHELTLVYEIIERRKRRSMSKRRIVPCAKF